MSVILAGKYRLDDRLGEGGMGIVHAGHHLALDAPIAIKLLRPESAGDASARARFLREARRAASIQGEHSVRILDVGESDQPHIVMERLVGETAAARLEREGAFSVSDAATIMLQLLDAVAEAHARGLVHRDLKPANVFLVEKPGEPIWVKVLDFGIAKAIGPEAAKTIDTLTEPHTLVGSPHYMSPEQLKGAAVDARSDLWSCGVVLYELLSARPPFDGATLAEVAGAVIATEPAPLAGAVPAAVTRMIERCLRKDPTARPSTSYDLASGLAPFAAPEARALLPRIRAWCKADGTPEPAVARRTLVSGLGLVLGAGACAFLVASAGARGGVPSPPVALATLDPPVAARPPAAPLPTVPSVTPSEPAKAEAPPTAAPPSSAPSKRTPTRPSSAPSTSTSGRIRTRDDIELLP